MFRTGALLIGAAVLCILMAVRVDGFAMSNNMPTPGSLFLSWIVAPLVEIENPAAALLIMDAVDALLLFVGLVGGFMIFRRRMRAKTKAS